MPFYVFQESPAWDGGNKTETPDPTRKKHKVRGKNAREAEKKLPYPGLGRGWVRIDKEKTD